MSYYDSPRFSQTYLKPIIRDSRKDSRESSLGSRTSNDSRSSAEYSRSSTEYGSSKSNTAYVDSYDRKGYRHYRVPDDGTYSLRTSIHASTDYSSTDRHYITSRRSPDGKVEVINHNKGRYDPDAPRSVDATPKEYSTTHRSSKHDGAQRHKS
jgi:hypothetical protein